MWTLVTTPQNAHPLEHIFPSSPSALAAVAYLGIITTAVCNYLQTVGQKSVSAERAAVIYAMDPVYGALFAWLVIGENLGIRGITGAFFIVLAAVVSSWDLRSGKERKADIEGKQGVYATFDDVLGEDIVKKH